MCLWALLQCLSGVFAALNGMCLRRFSAENGRVSDAFGVHLQRKARRRASFMYFCGIKRVCLWALLRRKIIVNTIFFAPDVVTGVVVAANIVNADAEVDIVVGCTL